MKKILILTSAVILMAGLVGCQRCCGLFRGSRLFSQEAAVAGYADPCVPVVPCDPCAPDCGAYGNAAPAVIVPGPETYAPSP
jgi:hypothetical protein